MPEIQRIFVTRSITNEEIAVGIAATLAQAGLHATDAQIAGLVSTFRAMQLQFEALRTRLRDEDDVGG